jgi:xylem cysteine proteinase
MKYIEEENSKGNSFTLGVTEFADLSHEEFKRLYISGYKKSDRVRNIHVFDTENLPNDVDWRNKGAVTPVKN